MRNQTAPPQNRDSRSAEELMLVIAERRDRAAFIQLFEEYGPRVKAYLIRQGADRTTAEDLTQDVMLTVWHRAAQFDHTKARFSTWVFTIARNRRIDGLRRTRRPEIDPNDPALTPDPDEPADRIVEAGQRGALLHAALKELPSDQAQLLRMAFFEEKSHSMIAAALSLPLGTVKSRLRLAMTKLRASLEALQ
jgi:RNA polymerase sigma-70 factor (ECF subfamily)